MENVFKKHLNLLPLQYSSTLFLNSGTLQAQGLESKDINAQISNKTILMTFMKHWPVCQLASYMAEIEVIIHNISKLWKVIHSKTVE